MMNIMLRPPQTVVIDGVVLYPQASLAIRNHSPDGFAWGYGGSGPSQLALAICLTKLNPAEAQAVYQQFKWDFVSRWPREGGLFKVDFSNWYRITLAQKERKDR